jgi:hypothetical protein
MTVNFELGLGVLHPVLETDLDMAWIGTCDEEEFLPLPWSWL